MDQSNVDRDRFEELLPFYVNKTLAADQRKWMDEYMAAERGAANALQFERSLSEVVLETRSSITQEQRLEQVLRESGLGRHKRSWLANLFTAGQANGVSGQGWRIAIPVPIFAVIAVLFVGQAAFIGLSARPSKENLYRGATPECADAVQLRVLFKPDARHEDVVLVLRKVEATVRAGPSETGELWISLPVKNSTENAVKLLRGSSTVDDVSVYKSGKQSEGCLNK